MKTDVTVQVQEFKGLDFEAPKSYLDLGAFSELVNFEIGGNGELFKRSGFTSFPLATNPGTAPVTPLTVFKTATTNALIVKFGSSIYTVVGSQPSSVTLISGATNCNSVAWAVQYGDAIYFISDSITFTLFKWDGTTFSTISGATVPRGTFGIVHKDRLFVAGGQPYSTTKIAFSAVGDFTSWPSTINVDAGDGKNITAFAILYDTLYIFKTTSIWALYADNSPETWTLRKVAEGIGCLSKYGVAIAEGQLYFSDAHGVYVSNGAAFELISKPIRRIFVTRDIVTLNQEHIVRFQDKLVCKLRNTGATTTNPGNYFVYYYKQGTWAQWDTTIDSTNLFSKFILYFIVLDSITAGTGFETLVAGNSTVASLYKFITGTNKEEHQVAGADISRFFDGTDGAFLPFFITGEIDLGDSLALLRAKTLALELFSYDTVRVTYIASPSNGPNPTVDIPSTAGTLKLVRIKGPGVFRSLKIKVEQLTTTGSGNEETGRLFINSMALSVSGASHRQVTKQVS